jgi:hypothetical protein
MYCDELIHTSLDLSISFPHFRFKGVDSGMIEAQALLENLSIPELYVKMINDKINNNGGL